MLKQCDWASHNPSALPLAGRSAIMLGWLISALWGLVLIASNAIPFLIGRERNSIIMYRTRIDEADSDSEGGRSASSVSVSLLYMLDTKTTTQTPNAFHQTQTDRAESPGQV